MVIPKFRDFDEAKFGSFNAILKGEHWKRWNVLKNKILISDSNTEIAGFCYQEIRFQVYAVYSRRRSRLKFKIMISDSEVI